MARLGDVRMIWEQRQQRWEYKVAVSQWDRDGTERWLHTLGQEGWQLVTTHDHLWVFMRPKGGEADS